jgi:hypothetical protein
LFGHDLEVEMLRVGFMKDGIQLLLDTLESIPEIIEDEDEY